jgi:hypothetical protein
MKHGGFRVVARKDGNRVRLLRIGLARHRADPSAFQDKIRAAATLVNIEIGPVVAETADAERFGLAGVPSLQ